MEEGFLCHQRKTQNNALLIGAAAWCPSRTGTLINALSRQFRVAKYYDLPSSIEVLMFKRVMQHWLQDTLTTAVVELDGS